MTTLLHYYYIESGWYLTSWDEDGPYGQSNPMNGEVYFRAEHDDLFEDPPTFFDTKEEAIASAEAMGFTVMQ